MTAPIYDRSFARLYDQHWALDTGWAQAIGRLLPAPSEKTSLLDVGCGGGRLMQLLLEAGYSVAGVDVSTALLASGRERLERHIAAGRATLAEADARTLELGRTFDAVVSTYWVLNHLAPQDLGNALARMSAHVALAGFLAVHVVTKHAAEAQDGAISVLREHGGMTVRRFLQLGEDEHLMFHDGFFRTDAGEVVPFEFRWRYWVHRAGDLSAALSVAGLPCVATFDVGDAVGLEGIVPVAVTDADQARDLLVLATRADDTLRALVGRLG
jgi:SAM-dependent methyltransferase